jgi:hypothetical protein
MAGSMYRKPSRLWVLRVYAGREPLTGKKVWKSRTFQGTKREAERALAAFVTEQPSAHVPAPFQDVRRAAGTLVRGQVWRLVTVDGAADPVDHQRQPEGVIGPQGVRHRCGGPRPFLRRAA